MKIKTTGNHDDGFRFTLDELIQERNLGSKTASYLTNALTKEWR